MDPVRNRVSVTTRTGPDGNGPALDGAARELLRATYLRPLRDAEAELRSGRGSRLSQILAGYPAMTDQGSLAYCELLLPMSVRASYPCWRLR
ncbi:hypothetical protein ACWGDT_40615 [Streptomyces avermitilis]